MRTLLVVTNALSDESRVRILAALGAGGDRVLVPCCDSQDGELCVCQIIELLDLAPSTVSKHLSILRQAGLIEGRKQGRWMYYRLAGGPRDQTPRPAREALAWLRSCLAGEHRVTEDAARLKKILKIEPEVLCCQQRENAACCSSAPATPAAARWPKGGPAPSRAT